MDRLPYRRIAKGVRGLALSSTTAYNIISRTGKCLQQPASKIKKIIRRAHILHVDETSIHYNGVLVWVWIFLDPLTQNVLYVIAPSRGVGMLRDVLGEEWKGIIVFDGWKPYASFRIQRCWAHIIRETEHVTDMCKCKKCQRVLKTLRKIYADACDTRELPKAERIKEHDRLHKRVKSMIKKYENFHSREKFMGKLGRALPNLFKFVLYPSISPTNNAAERGLREIVVHRKIRGGIRSEDRMTVLGNLFTCVTTWQNQGIDHRKEIKKYV